MADDTVRSSSTASGATGPRRFQYQRGEDKDSKMESSDSPVESKPEVTPEQEVHIVPKTTTPPLATTPKPPTSRPTPPEAAIKPIKLSDKVVETVSPKPAKLPSKVFEPIPTKSISHPAKTIESAAIKPTKLQSKEADPASTKSAATTVTTASGLVTSKPATATTEVKVTDAATAKSWEEPATRGSEEHQLKLGNYFLSLSDAEVAKEDNSNLAIEWYIKASKQGNEEATLALRSCVDKGMPGIDGKNASDIKWCLKTSNYEKKVRNAARSLFQKMNTTHKDAMSRDEYMEAIKRVTGKLSEQKLLMAAGKKLGDHISENQFIKILSKKIQGTITLTTEELTDTNVSYESAGYITKVVKYPRLTASVMIDRVLEYSSKEGMNWVVSLIPSKQLYILGLLFVYSFITTDFLFFFLPLIIFYLSFAAITICTLQMFYKKKKQNQAATLAGMLRTLDVTIDLEQTESQYSWNSLTPYIVFFSNLPLVICSFSLCNRSYIPTAEISVIALLMTVLCFFSLSDHHDKLTIFALLSNLLASLPVLLHNFPDVLILKQFINFLTDPFFVFETGVGIKLNISIPSIAYGIIPLFFVRMAMKKSWEGTYRVLVPHLICYFWFNILTTTFPFTTWVGLLRATAGYALLPLLIPVSMVGIFAMAGFAIYKALQTQMLGKIVVTFILLGVPIVMTQSKKLFGKKFEAKFGLAKKLVMIVFSLLALVPLIFVKIPAWKKELQLELAYENYTGLCFREKIVNDVPQQITCSHLIGTRVKWNGTVESVAVTSVENSAESVISLLPSFMAKPLYCLYGQEYPQCDQKLLSRKGFAFCTVMRGLGHECHVKNHNVYSFEILVLTGSQNIKIEAGDSFKETVLALEIGDTIEYRGFLSDNIGGTVPRLKLSSLKATNRDLPIMMVIEELEDKYMIAIHEAIAVTFNFLWYPILEFTV